jgi:P-type Ca2+ transporter type 2C
MDLESRMQQWHTLEVKTVAAELGIQPELGLTDEEARVRLEKYGPNELTGRDGKHPLSILLEQFTSTMVLILIAAAVLSAFLGKTIETIAIAAIVILFAFLGFFQEYRAERAMAALRKMTVPGVRVRRDGRVIERSARELVPGDVILLEAGNVVPVDVRLFESVNLRTQEAALTGESEPVEKTTAAFDKADLPLGDRRNMAYMGTLVSYGRGEGVAVQTGMGTELGKIAAHIQGPRDQLTPLQRRLNSVGKALALLGIAVAAAVLVIGVLLGESLEDMLLTAVSVAVAVVPEGLPAVVTITLALGAQRMLRRKALIRKLPAVETLGSVTVICSDKTGTLTLNRMTVTILDVAGHYLELLGTNRHPAPALASTAAGAETLVDQPPAIRLMLIGGALCNDAALVEDPQSEAFTALGDPTEGALLVAASQAGLFKHDLEEMFPRIAEVPFDSERRRMTTVHDLGRAKALVSPAMQPLVDLEAPRVAFTKGAVDGLLNICSKIWVDDHIEALTAEWRGRIRHGNEQMAGNGMRVLGMALKPIRNGAPDVATSTIEQGLVLIGLVGMVDPPRPEVRRAVAVCKTAGIRPVMITGDHPLTARFIAHDLGISDNGNVRTGQDIGRMSPEDLEAVVGEVSIYARVAPEHKLRIVEALQRKGHIVAMTGDGINDAPALKRSDIGVAMGITGTDVTKESSDMVLLDDNFATIVNAVEEGRSIYANIRRFVKFSIAGNIGKIIVMLVAPFFGITVALQPLQLLWLNLLTDGLLGLGLGLEAADPTAMQQPPRSPKAGFFSGGLLVHMVWVGALIGIATLALGISYFERGGPQDRTWQTMMFTTITFMQVGQALASRSATLSVFSLGVRSNVLIFIMILLVAGLQLAAIYFPPLVAVFQVIPLSLNNLAVCAGMGTLPLIAIEAGKWITRKRKGEAPAF